MARLLSSWSSNVGKLDRNPNCMLRIFCGALMPWEQFREDIHGRTEQGKIIKSFPVVDNYPPRFQRLHFLPGKGYVWVGDGFPSQELPQHLGIVEEEIKPAATCIY